MTTPAPTLPIVRTLLATDVPPAGTHVVIDLDADADARAALARFADLPAVASFRAELEIRPWDRDGFAVSGRVRAEITQSCVVTLEPVPGRVDEEVAVKLVPPEAMARYEEAPDEEGAIVVDAAADLPEPFEDGVIDVGGLAVEHFMVGIDPYPRKAGATFDAEAAGVAVGAEELSPFAALARLKKE